MNFFIYIKYDGHYFLPEPHGIQIYSLIGRQVSQSEDSEGWVYRTLLLFIDIIDRNKKIS